MSSSKRPIRSTKPPLRVCKDNAEKKPCPPLEPHNEQDSFSDDSADHDEEIVPRPSSGTHQGSTTVKKAAKESVSNLADNMGILSNAVASLIQPTDCTKNAMQDSSSTCQTTITAKPSVLVMEASGSKQAEASGSKQAEASGSKQAEASGSKQAEASGSKQAEASGSKQAEASGSKQAEVSGSKQAEASGSKQAEASGSKQAEASGSKQAEASGSKQAEVSGSKQAEARILTKKARILTKKTRILTKKARILPKNKNLAAIILDLGQDLGQDTQESGQDLRKYTHEFRQDLGKMKFKILSCHKILPKNLAQEFFAGLLQKEADFARMMMEESLSDRSDESQNECDSDNDVMINDT
ncbi:hypothetical protein EMCRGX_G007385 [Ephydatia muelleri]